MYCQWSLRHTLDITHTHSAMLVRDVMSQRSESATVITSKADNVIRPLVTTLQCYQPIEITRGIIHIGKLYVYCFWINCICFGVEFPFKNDKMTMIKGMKSLSNQETHRAPFHRKLQG